MAKDCNHGPVQLSKPHRFDPSKMVMISLWRSRFKPYFIVKHCQTSIRKFNHVPIEEEGDRSMEWGYVLIFHRKFTSTVPKALRVDYVSLVFGLRHCMPTRFCRSEPQGDVLWKAKRLHSESRKVTKDIEPSCIWVPLGSMSTECVPEMLTIVFRSKLNLFYLMEGRWRSSSPS